MKLGKYLLLILVPFLMGAAAVLVTPGLKTSEYPNRPTMQNTNLFLITSTFTNNSVIRATNANISFLQLSNQIANGLASITYVDTQIGGGVAGLFRGSFGNPNGNQSGQGANLYYDDDGGVWVHGPSSGNNNTNWIKIIE